MNWVIWKYTVEVGSFTHEMPVGAKVLHVEAPDGVVPWMWVFVDPDAEHTDRTFYATGTGHPVPADAEYLGTFVLFNNRFVGHLFG